MYLTGQTLSIGLKRSGRAFFLMLYMSMTSSAPCAFTSCRTDSRRPTSLFVLGRTMNFQCTDRLYVR